MNSLPLLLAALVILPAIGAMLWAWWTTLELYKRHRSNPWLKKNPFMSMWLSGANKIAVTARSQIAAEAKRQISRSQAEGEGQDDAKAVSPSAGL